MRKEKGFSLIELLIVVAIILIIAAIAVPNLLRSRMAANESSAVGGLRSISTANVTYLSSYNSGYASDLNFLGPPAAGATADCTASDLLDATLSGVQAATSNTSTKSGYVFTYLPSASGVACDPADMITSQSSPIPAFSAATTPVGAGSTGQRTFCVDQKNVVIQSPDDTTAAAGGAEGCEDGDFVLGGAITPL